MKVLIEIIDWSIIQICSRLGQQVHAHAHVANMQKSKNKSHPITPN